MNNCKLNIGLSEFFYNFRIVCSSLHYRDMSVADTEWGGGFRPRRPIMVENKYICLLPCFTFFQLQNSDSTQYRLCPWKMARSRTHSPWKKSGSTHVYACESELTVAPMIYFQYLWSQTQLNESRHEVLIMELLFFLEVHVHFLQLLLDNFIPGMIVKDKVCCFHATGGI